MIFIYPASVSENCDKRIVPAVAKCVERFFLFQLQDAIASGVLPLSRQWDGRNYGPILLECLNNYNKKQMLIESKYLTESTNEGRGIQLKLDELSRLISELKQAHNGRELESRMSSIDALIITIDNMFKRDHFGGHGEYDRNSDELSMLETRYDQLKKEYNDLATKLGSSFSKDYYDQQRNAREWKKDAREEAKEKREADRAKEEDARNASMHKTGSYIPMDSKIDIIPTSGTVTTNVLYKGGTLNGKSMEEVEFNISVKVVPTILKNFKVLEKDLLDDYFSKKSESAFKSRGRNVARAAYNVLKRLPFGIGDALWKAGMTIAGEDTERESRKDIIYNSQGFVNASAFHKSSSSPNNYNFTSNIVIFNKDDLTDPDDANMFENRSAMVRLFKMGWSTFCMLDPVEEMMYFISSLDGGFMHYIPYRYMMESYGSRSYYGTESKLKDSAKPFLIKRGNFAAFAKVFKKKSRK